MGSSQIGLILLETEVPWTYTWYKICEMMHSERKFLNEKNK